MNFLAVTLLSHQLYRQVVVRDSRQTAGIAEDMRTTAKKTRPDR
jgi:hypothetical protein